VASTTGCAVRDLDETDLLVICANALPLAQAYALMGWWIYPDPFRLLMHPSVQWWVVKNASAVQRMLAKQYMGSK
jgi:hypothetical protein